VLVAHHLPKLSAHLVTALTHLHVRNLTRRNSLGQEARGRKKRAEGEGVWAKALPQQVTNNSTTMQEERGSIRLYVYSGKLILAAMFLR
jgi:hypothetical protein